MGSSKRMCERIEPSRHRGLINLDSGPGSVEGPHCLDGPRLVRLDFVDRPDRDDGTTEGGSTEIATSTLAEIYERQGLYDRAIAIWRKLARRAPEDPEIASRIEALSRRLEASREGEVDPDAGESDREGIEEIPVPAEEGLAPTATSEPHASLEAEAARTGPPEDTGSADESSSTSPAPSPDEDERFQAWLAGK